jgi:hypothetical protein
MNQNVSNSMIKAFGCMYNQIYISKTQDKFKIRLYTYQLKLIILNHKTPKPYSNGIKSIYSNN